MSQAQAIIQSYTSCADDTYMISQILPPLATVLTLSVVVYKGRDPNKRRFPDNMTLVSW